MFYCVEGAFQNVCDGKYAVLGLSFHTFPLNGKTLLDQWLREK